MSPEPHEAWNIAKGLMASLAVGLLIGFERGWRGRERAEGKRVAGLRTFAFVGLLGGLLALLAPAFGPWPLVSGIFGVAAIAFVGYRESVRAFADLSATSSVVLLLTLALGALAAYASPTLALSAAVVVAVLLDMKSTMHRWLVLIEHREMRAALQILVLSVVVLPNLPDAGYGPYSALNPYRLWWAVILVAGLSLAGHFAMRLAGVQRGLFGMGLLGGLASSTAATLALARFARGQPRSSATVAAGALAACGVMFLRMWVLVLAVAAPLARPIGVPLLTAGSALLLVALLRWRDRSAEVVPQDGSMPPIGSFDLATALGFGAFLALIAVLIPAAQEWMGTGGVYAVAAISGFADVDAVVVSIASEFAADGFSTLVAGTAIGVATMTNMIVKGAIAWVIGGRAVGLPVLQGYSIGLVAGAVAFAL